MKAKLLPWVIVLAFLGVIAGVVTLVERISCSIAAKKAESAYSAGDFVNAENYYKKLLFNETDSENSVSHRRCPSRNEDFDFDRLDEISNYNLALQTRDEGDYQGAIIRYQMYLNGYPEGRLLEDASKGIEEIYKTWTQDTGRAGKDLMMEMYSGTCSSWPDNIPPATSLLSENSTNKYWFPDAAEFESKYIAQKPSDFRIAICSELMTTEVEEACQYSSGTGLLGTILRKNATYEIELVDVLNGNTIAKYQPVTSKQPDSCPQFMSGTNSNSVIVGKPDISSATQWIDEQMQSIQ